MTLSDYLKRYAAQAHIWGQSDCCCFPADWCLLRGRRDPMARWRGAYASQAEAEDLIERDGGLLEMFTIGCADAGIPVIEQPQRGDIGVLEAVTADGSPLVGGLYLGKRWAILADPYGVIIASAQHRKAWRP